ncbi:MAG: methyltransferase domain-containing protein, partial [Nitrospirota bacterium]
MDRVGRETKLATEIFDLYAEDYDKWFDSPDGRVLFEMEVAAVRLLMKDLNKPFLEIGVGTGRFAQELGIDFGIDPSKEVLKIAERRGIKVKAAAGEELPFEDGSFGTVFILFTLCFVKEPDRVLTEAGRVIRHGGRLIIGIINRESKWGEYYLQKKAAGHPIYGHARFYSINEVEEMLEQAGMTVEGYSSTLFQGPSETPSKELACDGVADSAGF